ncbi:hypothetical protein KI387_035934 [Taxus chinensis]|uniref:Glycosyl hydrolase family 32 N-terminal domain-containing protein n=1 Tax=Taxus chinensis TaxID=29808 RepID=A0AA38FSK7_TAXCH|nr:hypothetical protein KI387_035934 [Taxus chinensis]
MLRGIYLSEELSIGKIKFKVFDLGGYLQTHVELKVRMDCDGCERKVKKVVTHMSGPKFGCSKGPGGHSAPKWIKSNANPVLIPPQGINLTDFRDPTTSWVIEDGVWRIIIGSKLNKTGLALIYKTKDFFQYDEEVILHQVPRTGIWECVDFYPVNASGTEVDLKTSVTRAGVKHVFEGEL